MIAEEIPGITTGLGFAFVVQMTSVEKSRVAIGSAIFHSGFHQIRAAAIMTPMFCKRSPIAWSMAPRMFMFSALSPW